MDTDPQSSPQSAIAIIMIVVVICLTAVVIKPGVLPTISKPVPRAVQPISSISSSYQPEIIPPLPETPDPAQTATSVPANTLVPTQTLLVIPTLISNRDLPDLYVSGLSDPVCAAEYEGTTIRFTIFIRNIGLARTSDFGSFNTNVYFILGQSRYSLEEWDSTFNGLIGSSVTEVFNLDPNGDIKFTVVIDLKGNKNFGIEVIANSGESPIREADMSNNTLIKYFSVACY